MCCQVKSMPVEDRRWALVSCGARAGTGASEAKVSSAPHTGRAALGAVTRAGELGGWAGAMQVAAVLLTRVALAQVVPPTETLSGLPPGKEPSSCSCVPGAATAGCTAKMAV